MIVIINDVLDVESVWREAFPTGVLGGWLVGVHELLSTLRESGHIVETKQPLSHRHNLFEHRQYAQDTFMHRTPERTIIIIILIIVK